MSNFEDYEIRYRNGGLNDVGRFGVRVRYKVGCRDVLASVHMCANKM